MANIEDSITAAKDNIPNVTPTPPGFHHQSTAYELKSRLQWGEPGLTIVDVRDHSQFNDCRILGAVSMPMDDLLNMAQNLLHKRDIYVYGASDNETATAANHLRQAGFSKVSELKGGLQAWREIQGSIEGRETIDSPSSGAYNIGDRLREFAAVKAKERRMK